MKSIEVVILDFTDPGKGSARYLERNGQDFLNKPVRDCFGGRGFLEIAKKRSLIGGKFEVHCTNLNLFLI